MSLSRYSLTLDDQDTCRITTDRSKQIAIHIVAKVEVLLRKVLARLQHHFGIQDAATNFWEMGIAPRPEEINAAFDFLHIATCLAAEFGALKCFRSIETLCNDYVEHLPGVQTLRPLTLKAVSDLLQTKKSQKILIPR